MVGELELSPEFPPLAPAPIALFTALGVGLGAVVYALLARYAARPNRLFTAVASVALVLSLIPNLALALAPGGLPIPGATPGAFLALVPFHLVAGAVAIGALTTMTRAGR